MKTQRYHRKFNEAYGPYCSPLQEETRPLDWQDKLVIYVSLMCGICCLSIVVWGRA